MKRFLKVLGLVLVVAMAVTSVPVLGAENKVEISFCVGDETLHINGEAVTVEKPYVVGDGVTLVPLRVITEAFGATVEWIAETKSINLTYPDVTILLQIDNNIAEVNGKAEQLLSAPELTQNGFTMVPLRFISETFGANVSYDEVTRQITVVKETVGNDQSTVVGAVEEGMIGDSFYGWSMETPENMSMLDRAFDGAYTSFVYDENNFIDIDIYSIPKEYDFERDFAQIKTSLQGYTLVKADKDTSDAKCKKMLLQAKDKDIFMDIRQYVTDKYIFAVYSEFENANAEVRDEGVRLLSTFECTFPMEDVHDLSNVENGMRTYESEAMGFTIQIPAEYILSSSESVENELDFYKLDGTDRQSRVSVGIYSKSEAGTAMELADEDYKKNKEISNPKITTFTKSDTLVRYANINAYEYTEELKASAYTLLRRDVFFELGEYVYNVTVDLKNPDNKSKSMIDKIINSIKVTEINTDEVGVLLRNVPDYEGTFTYKGDGFTLQIPNSFNELSSGIFGDRRSGVGLNVIKIASEMTHEELTYVMQDQVKSATTQGYEIVQMTKEVMIGNVRYLDMTHAVEVEEEKAYYRQMAGVCNGEAFVFVIAYPEATYSEYVINQTEEVIKSLKLE